MKKNLVMAAATGYGKYEIEPFVESFKKNCPSADLVLFVDKVSPFTLNYLGGGGFLQSQFPMI